MANEDVLLRFGGDIQGLSAALNRATTEMSAFTAKMASEQAALNRRVIDENAKLEASLSRTGATLTSLGTRLTALVSLPIAGALAGAAKAAISFESAFANVGKTVDGVSDRFGTLTPQGNQLALAIRNLSKEIPKTTEELSAIAAMAGQMGVKAQDIATFTKHVAALGVAVDGISGEEAAMGLAQIGNVTGEGTKNIDKMASALVALGNDGNSTEGQILEFTKRLVGATHQIGMTSGETMALGAAMANLGINAEAGGTAMSTVLSKMAKAVATGGDQLEAFARVANRSADEFATVFRTKPVQAVQMFIDGLSTAQQRGANLYGILGDLGVEGIRMTDVLLRLSGAGDEFNRTLDIQSEGVKSANAHLIEAEKKYATTANQAKLLWNQIKDIGVTLGAAFIPMMKQAIDAATPFLQGLAAMAERFAEMPGWVQGGSIALLGLVAAGGPMLLFAGQAAQAVSEMIRLRREFQALSTASAVAQVGTLSMAVRGLLTLLGTATLVGGMVVLGGAGLAIGAQLNKDKEGTREWLKRGGGGQAALWLNMTKDLGQAGGVGYSEDAASQLPDLYLYLSRQAIERQKMVALAGGAWREGGPLGSVSPGADAIAALKRLTAEYNADLKKLGADGMAAVIQQHETFGRSLTDLATAYGVQETSLKRYIDLQKQAAQADEDAAAATARHFATRAKSLDDFHEGMRESLKATGLTPATRGRFYSQLLLENTGDATGLMASMMGRPLPSVRDNDASAGVNRFDFSGFLRNNMGGVVLQALTGGGSVGRSMGGLLGQGLTEKLMGGAVGTAVSDGLGKMLGSTIGGALGSIIPGLGTIAGSFIGTGISKLLGGLFGGEGKKVRQARSGFISENFGSEAALREQAAEAGISLDAFFNASKVKDYEKAVADLQKKLAEFNAAQAQQKANAAEFLQTLPAVLQGVSQSGRLASQDLLDVINRVRDTKELSGEVSAFIKTELEQAAGGLVGYLTSAVNETAVTSQSAADAFAAAITVTFTELQKQGVSTTEALAKLQPAITALEDQLKKAGLTGGAAFDVLAAMAKMAGDEVAGPALNAVGALNQTLVGLHNAGLMNQEMFAGLTNQVTNTFQRLVAQGHNGDTAMRMMQPTLQTIWELMQDFGYEVDDATRALVTQGVEAGIVGDQHRDANDRMARGIERLVELMEDFIATLRDIPDEAEEAAGAVEDAFSDPQIEWTPPWDGWSPPSFEFDGPPSWGGGGGGGGGGDEGGGAEGGQWSEARRAAFVASNGEEDLGRWDGWHTGGLVGFVRRAHRGLSLASDEVPLIAQTGEGILSRHLGMPALARLAGGNASRALDLLNRGQVPLPGGSAGPTVMVGGIYIDAKGAHFEDETALDALSRKIEHRLTASLSRGARVGLH